MTTFTLDQWLILTLVFVLGLLLGMALLASPKWKQRYREETTRREAAEAETERLRREETVRREAAVAETDRVRRDSGEMDSLRHAAARDEARRRDADVRDEAVRRDPDVRDEVRRRDSDERGPL
jgi:hypothetical protein